MGINSYADIIHQNTSWVIAGNWWMRDGVEKSVFITGKLNNRPPLCSVPSIYIFIWLKHLYQYFGSLDTVRKRILNEAEDFNVCMWVSEQKKGIKKMIALCIMAVIVQSKCYQMSNQVPNLPVSIDVRLMNIKTVSWLSFFSRSVLWVYSMHCTPDRRNKFQGVMQVDISLNWHIFIKILWK